MKAIAFLAALSLFALPLCAAETNSTIGKKIDGFTLRDCRGAERSLDEIAGKKITVVAFLGCECPLARAYGPRLADLAKIYGQRGVAFVGINSNSQDAPSAVADYARASGIDFPILKDAGNAVADRFEAHRTPEVFILDSERAIRYRGRIDDQYGIGSNSKKPRERDLERALDELTAGKAISVPVTEAPGCLIGRANREVKSKQVPYSGHVAPVLQKHCVECHRAGEIGPFAMDSFAEVSGWADMIDEVVQNGRMPPWQANPAYGHFKNDRRLSDTDKHLIHEWVQNGAPEGEEKGTAALASFEPGWRMGKPDMIVSIPKPFAVPAKGDVPYEFIAVNPHIQEDRWVKAAEIRPGARAVVHHVLVFVQPPQGVGAQRDDFASHWLVSFVPGSGPMILPEGAAKRIPAGSRLMFQIHYTPNGAPAIDQTSVGLIFADAKDVKHEIDNEMVVNMSFVIPAGDANYRVASSRKMREDQVVYRLMPHTHLRGKSFQFEATYPDGKKEILLDLPRYDFNWQNTYELAEPKLLPKGTQLTCTAYYDNSKDNRVNPNPNVAVRWGDQTWEEMMIGYYDSVPAHQKPAAKTGASKSKSETPVIDAALQEKAKHALDSQEAFDAFAAAVHGVMPKVDRVCLSTFFDGKLNMERVSYLGDTDRHFLPAGFEGRAEAYGLRRYAMFGGVYSNPDLSTKRGLDLKHMSEAYGSSVHAGIAVEGRPGSVNYWSRNKKAFSEHDQALLQALTQAVGMP